MKYCNECHVKKEFKDFHRHCDSPDLLRARCKSCVNQGARKRAEKKKHTPEYKLYYKKKYLRDSFNLSIEEYNELFRFFNGNCGICGMNQSDLNRPLCIDHNHISNEIRGLLCNPCNMALGQFKCDKGPELLINAINYLNQKTYKKIK